MKRSPLLVVLLAWLVPGAGHWVLGQRVKGVLFCVILVALFLTGTLLSHGGSVNVRPVGWVKVHVLYATGQWTDAQKLATSETGRHPFAFDLQLCVGATAVATVAFTHDLHEYPASSVGDFGMLLTLVAGALNVLVMSDALYRTGPAPAEGEAA